jgi:hypothetical protein
MNDDSPDSLQHMLLEYLANSYSIVSNRMPIYPHSNLATPSYQSRLL